MTRERIGWIRKGKITRQDYREIKREVIAHDKLMDHNKLRTPIIGGFDLIADRTMKRTGAFLAAPKIRARHRIESLNSADEFPLRQNMEGVMHRLSINALNPNVIVPPQELAMKGIESLSGNVVVNLLSLVPFGSWVQTGLAEAGVFVKFATADSRWTKIINTVTSQALAAADLLPIVAYFVNAGRLNKGYDLGDSLSDLTGIADFQHIFDDSKIANSVKEKLARTFHESYNKIFMSDRAGHAVARRGKAVIEPVTNLAEKAANPVKQMEDKLGFTLPIVGGVETTIKDFHRDMASLNHLASHDAMSTRDRVQDILTTADDILAPFEQFGSIRKALKDKQITPRQFLSYERWKYAKAVAQRLNKLEQTALQYYDPNPVEQISAPQS